jgi:hypothetical protein
MMTWAGTRVQQTLVAMFAASGTDARDEDVGLVFDGGPDALAGAVRRCLDSPPTPEAAAAKVPNRYRRKYDRLLSEELLDTSIAAGWLDLPGATELLSTLMAN